MTYKVSVTNYYKDGESLTMLSFTFRSKSDLMFEVDKEIKTKIMERRGPDPGKVAQGTTTYTPIK